MSRPPVRVVEGDVARLHPFQFAVVGADDAEFGLDLPLLRGERGLELVGDAQHVFAEDGLEPRVVTLVEIGQAVQRQELGRKAHHAGRYLPFEYADAPRFLRELEELFGLAQA
jgi:hypothetical protein